MSDPKVTAAHLRRAAAVYCRQSTLIQVERNRESTLRQYHVSYVFYGPEEIALGSYDPASASYLTEVYNEGDTKVYKVDPTLTAG